MARPLVGGFIQQVVEWWLSHGEWGWRQIPASSPDPLAHPALGHLALTGWAGGPRNSLGAVLRGPEPSPGAGLAQALGVLVNLSPIPVSGACLPAAICIGSVFRTWPPPCWWPEEPEAHWWVPSFLNTVMARQSLGILSWGSLQLRSTSHS